MNIPFTHPYTAPDGTTRRPLCERVPECVPVIEGLLVNLDGIAMYAPFGYVETIGKPDSRQVARLSEAASFALWRVAVEDWLLVNTPDCLLTLVSGSDGFAACWPPNDPNAMPTMLDALNAAAHAVADAIGTPH